MPPPITTVLTAPSPARRARRSARTSCATRSPFGSYSGSARTSAFTQSPKMSTASGVPGLAVRERDVRERDARVRPRSRSRRSSRGRRSRRRPRAPAPSRARSRADRRARGRRASASLLACSASAPMNSPLSRFTANAEPGLVRRRLGVQVAPPRAVALLETQRVDRAVAARRHAASGDERVPELQPVLGRAVELPAELSDVGDARRDHRDVPDRELARPHVREVERRLRQRLQHLDARAAPRGRGTRRPT